MRAKIVMRNDGVPFDAGWYWVQRVGTKHVSHGELQIVELKRRGEGDLWGDGFGEMELSEIGYAWQAAKPPEFVLEAGD